MSAPAAPRLDDVRSRLHRWDIYAASLSGLCLIHCLALPLIATLLPVLGQLSEVEWMHQAFVGLAIPATLWVIWQSRADHGLAWFRFTALVGLSLLASAAFVVAIAAWEHSLTIAGAAMLGGSHLRRWRLGIRSCHESRVA